MSKMSVYKKLLIIGLPIAIQNLIATSLNMLDNIMISSRGEISLAAVSLANRYSFILMVTLFGVYSGIGIFTSQYWGKKDIDNVKRVTGMSLTIGTSLAFLITILLSIFPYQMLTLFIKDLAVVNEGVDYISIAVFSYIPMSISFAFAISSRSVHMAKTPMITSIIALSINTVLNYLLINGNYGFPELGVKGAAIATVISRVIELIILIMMIFLSKKHPLAGKIKVFFSYSKKMLFKVIRTAIPVVINEFSWSIGTTIYYIAFGILGASVVASVQVALTITDFSWAFLIGLGSATSVLVGNRIGEGKPTKAFSEAKKLIHFQIGISIILALALAGGGAVLIQLFNLKDASIEIAKQCVYINAIYLPIKMITFVLIVGVLRGGGDTKFCMLLDIGTIYLIGVPLAFISVSIFKLPVYLCLAIVLSEEAVKAIIAIIRFRSRKWINNVTTLNEA